jgi:O-antigen ligase
LVAPVHQAGRGSAVLAACGLGFLAVGILEAGVVSALAKGGWVLLTILTGALDPGIGVALYLVGAAIYSPRHYAGWGSFGERPDNFAVVGLVIVGCFSILIRGIRPGLMRVALIPGVLVVYGLSVTAVRGGLDRSTFAWLMRTLGLPLLLFVLLRAHGRRTSGLATPLGVVTALAAYMGVVSLLEAAGAHWLIRPDWIADPSINGTLGDGRSGGTLMQSEFNGLALTLAGLLSLGFGWTGSGARRLLATLAAMLAAIGVFLSYSRGPWLGAVLAAAVLWVAAPRAAWRPPTVVGIGLPIALVALLAAFPSGMARERARDTGTVNYRLNLWAAGLRMAAERPLVGYGFGQFERDVGAFHRSTGDVDYQPLSGEGNIVHNTYLNALVELGSIGLILYVAAVGGVVREGLRGARLLLSGRGTALVVALSTAYFFNGLFVNLHEPFTNGLYFGAMGLLAGGSPDAANG